MIEGMLILQAEPLCEIISGAWKTKLEIAGGVIVLGGLVWAILGRIFKAKKKSVHIQSPLNQERVRHAEGEERQERL